MDIMEPFASRAPEKARGEPGSWFFSPRAKRLLVRKHLSKWCCKTFWVHEIEETGGLLQDICQQS